MDTKHNRFPFKDNQRKNRGITLIEVLLSFSIITLLIMGLAQLTLHSLFVKRNADCVRISAELAFSKLEYFKSLPFESEELSEGTKEESIRKEAFPGFFKMEWVIRDVSFGMKRINVECFSEDCPKRRIKLVLYLSKDLEF